MIAAAVVAFGEIDKLIDRELFRSFGAPPTKRTAISCPTPD
jgi:hypothetical protein